MSQPVEANRTSEFLMKPMLNAHVAIIWSSVLPCPSTERFFSYGGSTTLLASS